ncbi:MAG TPA: glycosyltransferase family 2 protein [Patescibacteria group bacterium]|nr:glycosyltransferase family 2 protein [Patescibacteria group bacterium]
MKKLSIVLATRNEQENLARCLESVKGFADEIIVVDEYSTDKTVEIAKKYGAKVFLEPHHAVFHITKQKALDKATGEWVLQLDADEVISDELAKEIKLAISHQSLAISPKKQRLFNRHQRLIENRDGLIGKKTGEIVGYFIARRNMFLGKPLIHGGVYPDGVIRLVKNGKAHFPQKSVHEQIELDGEVYWLSNDMLHYDSPTFERYLTRLNRYTDLQAVELEENKVSKGFFGLFQYTIYKPLYTFLNLYIRHLGFLDGMRGFVWALFSSLRYPIAYFKYWVEKGKDK